MPLEAGLKALRFLEHRPGASDGDYAAEAGISQSGAHQVLRRLEMEGMVLRIRPGRRVASFLTPAGRAALASPAPSTRDLVQDVLQRRPGISRRALAQELGVSPTTVQYHVGRLQRPKPLPA